MAKKTTQEKLVAKLQNLENFIKESTDKEDIILSFMQKYIICEICYKALLLSYRSEKGKDINESSLKINFGEAKKVYTYFNYQIDEEIIKKVFSSSQNKGEMSAKVIRDKIVHKIDLTAIKELSDRNEELNTYIDEILNLYRNNDNEDN